MNSTLVGESPSTESIGCNHAKAKTREIRFSSRTEQASDKALADSLRANSEAELEAAITLECTLLQSAKTIEDKRLHLERMQILKANRTPETVARLERERMQRIGMVQS